MSFFVGNVVADTAKSSPNIDSGLPWKQAIKPVSLKSAALVQANSVADAKFAKVKTIVQDAVKKYWKVYQEKFPEAFATNKLLKTSTPEIVFMDTKEQINKEAEDTNIEPSETNAFARPEYPNKIYVYTPNMIKKMSKFGDNALRATIAHELMHNLTNKINKRIGTDAKGITETFKGVKDQLKNSISLLPDGRQGQILQFSVEDLLIEGGADTLSIATTGIKSSHIPYQSIRDLSAQLRTLTGKDTYRKAYISNDPIAYKILVNAALKLAKGYNEVFDKKRISHAISEFNKTKSISFNSNKLDPDRVKLLIKKYKAEALLKYNLDSNHTEIKKYNFTFSDIIKGILVPELDKKRMSIEEATDKDIDNAVRTVWKRTYPNK